VAENSVFVKIKIIKKVIENNQGKILAHCSGKCQQKEGNSNRDTTKPAAKAAVRCFPSPESVSINR